MSLTQSIYGQPFPRRQAQRLVELLSRPESALRGVLLGRRREGKSDLLRQVRAQLFQRAEGPLPFLYALDSGRQSPARDFMAAFCQQMRAFLMRQEESLDEPLVILEKELDRSGLPLSLAELGREFLALAPADQAEFAAALPQQFAHREGRPVCLLLDDAETPEGAPALPLFSYLDDARVSWLITGRRAPMRQLAAERAWPAVALEPLSFDEALDLAETRCEEFELGFSRDAWEAWFDGAGTSPALVDTLVQSAALTAAPLDTVEALGRVYARELAAGSIGNWMAGQWERALNYAVNHEGPIADSSQRGRVLQHLRGASVSTGGAATKDAGTIPPAVWEGLIAEEWAEQTPLGAEVRLTAVEQDWLGAVSGATSPERAAARVLQGYLLRTEQARQWRQAPELLQELRDSLLHMPPSHHPAAESSAAGAKELSFPRISSVAGERGVATAELFWCYGFRTEAPKASRRGAAAEPLHRRETPCLLLIALCREEPDTAEVKLWSRRLQEESRGAANNAANTEAASGGGQRSEFWVAVPKAASLAAVSGEVRLRWEALARLLREHSERKASAAPPAPATGEAQNRLRELEARAQWLEEELATARELFHREASAAASESGDAAPDGADDAAADLPE